METLYFAVRLTPLLVAEIQAVLEDTLKSPLFPDSVVEDWCNNKDFGKHAQALIQGVAIKSFAYDFCRFGYEATSKHSLNSSPSKKQLQTVLCPDDETATPPQPDISSMKKLAVLMSQRTHYDSQRRFLKLGTILKECAGQKRYLICIQPVCDSTRLKGSNPFLFCYMLADSTKKTTHIVPSENSYCELTFNPSKENRTTIGFTANHKMKVAAERDTSTGYLFSDDNENKFQWVAQLKPEHAQRAVEQFASELSRVGLTESEWLRVNS
jgi:hypothetical protein